MKKTLLLIASLSVLGTGCFAGPPPIVQSPGKYCGPDGTLTDTMPIQSHRSYCLVSDAEQAYPVGASVSYSFTVVDDRGETLKDFAITHEKLMHLIVARKDLASFQHLHPDFDAATGRFTLPNLTFPEAGPYRVFADFAAAGGMMDPMGNPLGITLSEDVVAGSLDGYAARPLGPDTTTDSVDGLDVTLATGGPAVSGEETTLTFDVDKDGKPADLERYLGALGHVVILREGTLDFIHTHPEDGAVPAGKVSFDTFFPEGGRYKIFAQFQVGGQVYTSDFVITVASGENSMMMMGH